MPAVGGSRQEGDVCGEENGGVIDLVRSSVNNELLTRVIIQCPLPRTLRYEIYIIHDTLRR